MATQNIKEIIALIKQQDSRGYELLYQHYFRFLFSIAYAVLNNEEASCDVIQSVMMRLYQLDEKLFPRDHELSWLKTVVKNEALMYLRKEKFTVPLEQTADFPVLDQRIEDFVDMEQFHRLTAGLNEKQRKVVTMKILGDMTHREIAQTLAMPIGTVQWLYNTSIKELRRLMAGLAVLVLCLGGGMAYQLIRCWQAGQAPGQLGIASIPPAEPAVSPWLWVSIALFVGAVAAFAGFFVFSDRLPTKRFGRRIR